MCDSAKWRVVHRFGLSPVCLIFALVFALDKNPLARQVAGNVVAALQQPQLPAQPNNGSLPVLSERANGLNSRYLSAASTASLAAATVAAANQSPGQGVASANGANGAGNNNNNNNNNQALHQHQHQQPQASQLQQVAGAGSGQQHAFQGQQAGGQAAPVQYSAGQSQQQPQQAIATPVVSTTYTYNPLTGQFVPSELATGSLPGAGINQLVQQQQQSQPQQQFVAAGAGPLGAFLGGPSFGPLAPAAVVSRQPVRFGGQQQPAYQPFGGVGSSYGAIQQQLQFNNQQQRHLAPAQVFTRRNGLVPFRNAGQFGQPTIIDDDSNGLFQQQQVIGNSFNLVDQFGNPIQDTSGYLLGNPVQQQQQQQQQQQSFEQQPSSIVSQSAGLAPVVFPAPATSTAFGSGLGAGPSPGAAHEHNRNDQCVAADGRHGTCYQASECIKRGGTPMGKCGSSVANSRDELPGSSHVCCLFDITCGQFAAERFVYFRNPNYPNTFDQTRMCRAKIGKLDKSVCQFRLDLMRFDVARPTNGNCSTDMFVVSGQNENYVIPKICGLNDGQHYYVGVDESGVITLHMMMMGYYRRSFEILITQIPCRSDYAAPAHCLQYFMGTHGTIKSFNYDDDFGLAPSANQQIGYDLQQDGSTLVNLAGPTAPYGLQFATNGQSNNINQPLQQRQQFVAAPLLNGGPQTINRYHSGANILQDQFGGYPNDLDYTICIRKESGFCSITYQLSRSEQGLSPFAVGHSLYGNDTSGSWHPVSTECRDDYLLIGGVRLCSGTASPYGPQASYHDNLAAQFGAIQNGSILGGQQQGALLMQQLARIQQQQAAAGNGTYSNNGAALNNGINNSNVVAAGQQQQTGSGNNNANLDQQQAAIMQQLMLIQQQQNLLASGAYVGQQPTQQNNRYQQTDSQYSENLQGAIITDTTSGPFLLRFVSNMARNARGFHIDYRQNPCK